MKKNYLFAEIAQRQRAYLEKNPEASLISLGIGDVSHPIPEPIIQALVDKAKQLGTPKGFSGYGPSGGNPELRTAIASQIYQSKVDASEVFISDGAKPDLGRLQLLFDRDTRVAVQDPTYPVYVDTTLLTGKKSITYLPCLPENNFFPDLEPAKECDVLFFCSPNNPTGIAANREQLQALVHFAHKHHLIILYDGAYSAYIQDPSIPRSIYDIPGADEVAIETNSFSKVAGFTGVRLGWSVVPKKLKVYALWERIVATFFNGPCNIAEAGGLAVLKEEGWRAVNALIAENMRNAAYIKRSMESYGYKVYGGNHAPYLWIECQGRSSWDEFDRLLTQAQLIMIPGSGFGPSGEGFFRMSAFPTSTICKMAMERMRFIDS